MAAVDADRALPGPIAALIEGWSGERVIARRDAEAAAWCFIAIHDATLGMPVGGCRLQVYRSGLDGLRDAMRLAEGMTYKWACLEFPFGGGKAVLSLDRPLDPGTREGLLLRFARLIDSLDGAYATGEDMGTTPDDMRRMAGVCRFVMGQVTDAGETRSADPGPYTALGVLSGMRVALRRATGADLGGARVLVQGVGDVGRPLARALARDGARVVLADTNPETAAGVAAEIGAAVVSPEAAGETECDVFAPCAAGAVLNPETIPRLRCQVVAGSANNQLATEADAETLHERGVLYVPDFVVNAGGALAFGLMHRGVSDEGVLREKVSEIGDTVDAVLAEAEERETTPLHAAYSRARSVLERERREPGRVFHG
jgi:leucine dehydrogenase